MSTLKSLVVSSVYLSCHCLIFSWAAATVLAVQVDQTDFMKGSGISLARTPEQLAQELKQTEWTLTFQILADRDSYPKIHGALQLVESQKNELKDLLQQSIARHKTLVNEFVVDGIIPEDRNEEFSRQAEADSRRLQAGIQNVLLPHQAETLTQITRRVAFEKVVASISGQQQLPGPKRKQSLWPDDLSRSLGLRSSELQKLENEVPKIEAELEAKVADLRRDALKKIVALLPEDKRQLVDAAILARPDPELLNELRTTW
jgi:hypothetical protein